jgi:hypothetical protein
LCVATGCCAGSPEEKLVAAYAQLQRDLAGYVPGSPRSPRSWWRTRRSGWRVLRVRDAYLEAYGGDLDSSDARRLAQPATWTGKSARALSWRRALATANAEELAEYGDSVPRWLEGLLSPGRL